MHNNISKFYYFKFFLSFAFFYSTFVIFLQSKGLSLTQVMFIFSAHSATALLIEVPGGAFADIYGKKKSILLGVVGIILSYLINGFGIQFWHFIIASIIGGIGWSFISGADNALIHTSLDENGKKDEYPKAQGKSISIAQIANAAGGFFGALLYTIAHALPLFATALSTAVAFSIALTFKQPQKIDEVKPSAFSIIKSSFSIIRHHPQLLWLTIFTSFLTAVIWSVNVTQQPYMQLIGIPVKSFGLIMAFFAGISALASFFLHKFKKFHTDKYLLLLMGITAFVLILMGLKPSFWVFTLFSLVEITAVVIDILVSTKILDIVDKKQATTVLSFQYLGIRSINIITSPMIGWLSDKYGLPTSLIISGCFLLGILLLLVLLKYKNIMWINSKPS